MNISGILVTANPAHLHGVLADLAGLPGLTLGQTDAALGRIVVLQEAAGVDAEMAGFMRIRALPHVLNADLVCHWFGDEAGESSAPDETPSHSIDATAQPPRFAIRQRSPA
jgi:nitrate reductase NapAB chaperone NapD